MYSQETIKLTKELWEPKYGRSLSDNEAEDIIRNLTNYFDVLIEWDQEDKRKKALDEQ